MGGLPEALGFSCQAQDTGPFWAPHTAAQSNQSQQTSSSVVGLAGGVSPLRVAFTEPAHKCEMGTGGQLQTHGFIPWGDNKQVFL